MFEVVVVVNVKGAVHLPNYILFFWFLLCLLPPPDWSSWQGGGGPQRDRGEAFLEDKEEHDGVFLCVKLLILDVF